MSATGTFELFTSATAASDLRVTEWSCVEAVCEPFRLELSATCEVSRAEELASTLLGQAATFAMRTTAGGDNARRGVVVESHVDGGVDGTNGRLRIVIAPRLALMDMKVHSRIFQAVTTKEIIEKLLEPWQLVSEFQLASSHHKRSYCTQYRETDLAFLKRICALEGLGFFLAHEPLGDDESDNPASEKLVFVDEAHFCPPIPDPAEGSGGSTLEHSSERFGVAEYELSGFGLARAVRTELVRLGDFDFRRPGLSLSALSGLSKDQRSPIGDALGGEMLASYLHADRGEFEEEGSASEIDETVASIRLAQLRQRAQVGRARSRCQRLSPGRVFRLDHHPMGGLNGSYVVTRVEHQGRIPEGDQEEGPIETYENRLECVPSSILTRPTMGPPPIQQAMETATVVGPKDEEIHVDEHGRVKVQFHWDLEGKRDDKSSCWLRVSQPWAGANWGAQFLPRIGAEVLVGFIGGDIDRPVVMGSLYNGVRPTPYRLPAEVTKSGFRSQSTPGGEGFSELTFDDDKGRENMLLRAQRDFTHIVENNYELSIKSGEKVNVQGASERSILGDSKTTISGEGQAAFAKSYQMTVQGSHAVSVNGDSESSIAGNRITRIEGKEQLELEGFQATYRDSQIERVLGHLVTVVGQQDAHKSHTVHVEGSASQFATGTTEITSDKEIVLRVGESSLRLTPEGIELVTKKVLLHAEEVQAEAKDKIAVFAEKNIALHAEQLTFLGSKKVVLKGEEGQLQLDKNARLDGTQVKLNCQPDPVDEESPPEYEPPKKTTICLNDEDGKAMPGRRYVIVLADGSERAGMLDENGKAEVYIEEDAKVIFPDADQPRKA
jgi:type VI secretion system secreted protein VgrG